MDSMPQHVYYLLEALTEAVAEGVYRGLSRWQNSRNTSQREVDESNDHSVQLLTAKQAASLLGLPPRRVYELRKRGELPYVPTGQRQIRFRRQALEAWLAEREAEGRDSRGTQDEPSGR